MQTEYQAESPVGRERQARSLTNRAAKIVAGKGAFTFEQHEIRDQESKDILVSQLKLASLRRRGGISEQRRRRIFHSFGLRLAQG
jgi:hypothetical protein